MDLPCTITRSSACHCTGAGEHQALHVGTTALQLSRRLGVGHARDVLLDDRALVEVGRRVVRGRADELDAASLARAYGFAPMNAGRNEWWMLINRHLETG